MKIRAKFEKQQLNVGLSASLPMAYKGPEEKYTLADMIAQVPVAGQTGFVMVPTTLRYERASIEIELQITSDELSHSPERLRCYKLISVLPQEAVAEVEADLRETFEHYRSIAVARKEPRLLPAKPVTASILQHVKT